MIQINDIFLPLNTSFDDIADITAKQLKINRNEIISAKLYKKSVDARKRNDIKFCCSVVAELKNEEKVLKSNKKARFFEEKCYKFVKAEKEADVVVVGFGPAGMFAALTLAKAGLKPIVVERGSDVDTRSKQIDAFFSGERLNTESNVQFGEGGAGTFSDGKLNTGIKDIRCREVLKQFCNFGADKKILYEAKPHIGTDVLKNVVKNLRYEIIRLGGQVRFDTKLTDISVSNGKITDITLNENEKIKCDYLLLAIGHSSRDTFKLLKEKNVEMCKKPFSVGVRIEHLQKDINKSLYGEFSDCEALGAADYKAAVHLENGRGVYTFCMCPGGYVINSSSEENTVTVNGMSYSKRDGLNANSAVLTDVKPEDLPDDVLAGCEFQRKIEKAAYDIAKGAVPVTTVGKFVFNENVSISKVMPTVLPKTEICDFNKIFPEFAANSLKEGIKLIDNKIKGFADKSAVLTAPETRSSSPVRILRNESGESLSYNNLFPSGEGAGYAGGIMSAAVDGIKTAENIIFKINN